MSNKVRFKLDPNGLIELFKSPEVNSCLELTEQIQLRIYENAWTLIQRATEEAANRIR